MKEFKGKDRFQIQRRLGAGGFGVVYQAFDKERNSLVALKTLSQADPETLIRFKREFRVLANLTHKNLIQLYELISDGEQWFFTMELIEGTDFLTFIRKPSQANLSSNSFEVTKQAEINTGDITKEFNVQRESVSQSRKLANKEQSANPIKIFNQVDFDKLRFAFRQLVEGISVLHDAGIIHRDLKPGNVLVTPESRIVILDFGLAAELAPRGTHQSSHITGTPAYMSPEQGAGYPLTKATDWYSVGVMLYEALTGVLPFDGSSGNILMEKLQYKPDAPAEVVSDIPEDLNDLCLKLLEREPLKRPSSAVILDRFRNDNGNLKLTSPIISQRETAFIGRQFQLQTLNDLFNLTKQQYAVIAHVHGYSGMGKSSLINHFLEQIKLQEPNAIILSGKCYENESVPYKAFDIVIDSLSTYLKKLPRLVAETLLPLDILALARLFPVLNQVEAVTGARRSVLDIPDSFEQRRRAFAAMRELLSRLAIKNQVIIFIDDLQWGDADSALLIEEILRPPDPPNILLICSYRSEEIGNVQILKALRSSQPNSTARIETREIVLNEMNIAEVKELASILFKGQANLTEEQAEQIIKETYGNPFFIEELLRNSSIKVANNKTKSFEQADTLDQVIYNRILCLTEDARTLLELIAVAGQPILRTVIKAASGMDIDDQPLSLLKRGRLIKVAKHDTQEELETYHDRIRETVISHLSDEILKGRSLNLALALESSEQADPELLFILFNEAEIFNKAYQYAIAAAYKASELLAFDRAARFYQYALDLNSIDGAKTQFLKISLGNSLFNTGRTAEAAQVYLSAINEINKSETVDLRRRAAECLLRSGNVDKGLDVLATALTSLNIKIAKNSFLALLSLLFNRLKLYIRGYKFIEHEENKISPEDLLRIDICWSAAVSLVMVDNISGADFQARHLLLALKAGEPYRVSLGLALLSGFMAASGNYAQASEILVASRRLAEKVGHPHAIGLVTMQYGVVALCSGKWKEALEFVEEADRIFCERCTRFMQERINIQDIMLGALQFLGNINEISLRLPLFLKEAQERNNFFAEANLRLGPLSLKLLLEDRVEDAKLEVKTTIEKWSRKGFFFQHYLALLRQVEIALYDGKYHIAWELITNKWSELSHSLLLRVRGILLRMLSLRARSALAMATTSSNPQSYLKVALNDAKMMEKEKLTWGNALAQLIKASIVHIQGNKDTAIKHLLLAESLLKSANMMLHLAVAQRCRGKLLSGPDGIEVINTAEGWMKEQQIKRPERVTAMIAPGQWL